MRTMHPVLKRGGLYWDQSLLPPEAYKERFARIQSAIVESGDDAWLFYGDVERYGAVAWFSNFLPRTRAALAFVPREGEPVLLLAVGLRDVPAAKTLTWVDDVRPYSNLPRSLAALIEEKGLAKGRIGLAGVEELLPVKHWNDFNAAMPGLKLADRAQNLAPLRARKAACEIAAIRAAATIVRRALDNIGAEIRAGRKMREVTAVIDRQCRVAAAEDVRVMVASGEQTGQSLRPGDDRMLQNGDVIQIYLAVEAQRYWAEGARTFVIGKAGDAIRAAHARANAAMRVMQMAFRSEVTGSEIASAGLATLGDAELMKSAGGYGLGNGVGLDADEFPRIEVGSPDMIADHSTLALRLIGHANGTGIALAETLLWSGGKVESLTGATTLTECN